MQGGSAKGSDFERLVCRRLTYWITGQEKPEIFWRSATSGAKATRESQDGRDSHMGGDIVAVHPDGYPFVELFSVECKNRKEFGRIENVLVDEGKSPFMQWWKDCEADAYNSGKVPLLIFKGKWTPTLVMFHRKLFHIDGFLGFSSEVRFLMLGEFGVPGSIIMELDKWIYAFTPEGWYFQGRNYLSQLPPKDGGLIKVKP